MLFRHCDYWRTWNRVLTYQENPRFLIREFSLTPINPNQENNWQELREGIIIREHCTTLNDNDLLYSSLPAEVRALLVEKFGRQYTERLLNWDEKHLNIRRVS